MTSPPRVAFLPDSFHEVNGAARSCRELVAFASRRQLPFFSVRFGDTESFDRSGPLWTLDLKRSRLRIPVDSDLYFDPLFYRLRARLEARLREFQPDLIHITSPGDLGILGAIAASALRVPLVLSWHTNLHEFLARRVSGWPAGKALGTRLERFVLNRVCWFFGRGDALLAPNQELVDLLRTRTRKPVFLMARGVDTEAFRPEWRTRNDSQFVIGYVGRLMPEKNVRFFAELESALEEAVMTGFRLSIVGGGHEAEWLRSNLRHAYLPGVLKGESLSRAYADMDLFVFPSRTDTFGNVVQEAHASGVPAIVTASGGPKFLVEHGVDGFVCATDREMIDAVLKLMRDPGMLRAMKEAAREKAAAGWDRVFEGVYDAYGAALHARAR